MLETQNVPISFAGGLDTKTDPKLVLPGKLILLENGVFTVGKTIKKRNGYNAFGKGILGTTNSISKAQALTAFQDELCLLAQNHLYSYSKSANGWIDKGQAYLVQITNNQIIRNSAQQSSLDCALSGGVQVYAWQDSRGGVRASIIDQATAAPFQSDIVLNASGATPRCVVSGAFIFVLYAVGGAIKARRYNPASPTSFDAEFTVAGDLSASAPHFDCRSHGSKAIVAYHSGVNTKFLYLTQDGIIGSTIIGLPNTALFSEDSANSLSLAVDPVALTIYAFYHNGTSGLRYLALNPDFTVARAASTLDAATATVPRSTALVQSSGVTLFYENGATNPYDHLVKQITITPAGVASSPSVLARSLGLASRAFTVGDDTFVNCAYDSTLQATFFTLKADGTVVAKLLPNQAGGLLPANGLPNVIETATDEYSFAAQVKTKFVSEGNTTYTLKGVSQSTIKFNVTAPCQSSVEGENLHIAGGVPSIYDGISVTEHGFHLFPENVTATPSTSGGSMSDGSYQYFAVYEWVDNRGQVHRSAPSVGVTANVSGGSGAGKVTLTLPSLRVTGKTGTRANAVIAIYRTLSNQTIAYRVTTYASPLYNDPTVDSVTYTDTAADNSIRANEILYTTGGEVETIAPPSCSLMESYKDRLVVSGLEDGLSLWFSKYAKQGEGIAFSDSFTKRVNSQGGKVAATKFMDDKLLIFKKSLIFVMAGDGPLDTGAQDTFTEPEMVTSDVGCQYPQSLVLFPSGVMFKSEKGIYQIDRSLQVSYIGADVEAYNGQNIVSAQLLENQNQVRFLTDSGVTLVYDYFFQQWSTFTNHEGLDSTIWQGSYVYLRKDGTVYQEQDGYFLDDLKEIRLRIGTAWLKMAGVQGYQRVRRAGVLGNYRSAHILRIQVGYDYEPNYPDVFLFNAGEVIDQNYYGQDAYFGEAAVYGGVADNVYQFRLRLRRQKCEAIRFLFEDVTAGTAGEGYSLSDLSLEVGVKRGLAKLRAEKSIG